MTAQESVFPISERSRHLSLERQRMSTQKTLWNRAAAIFRFATDPNKGSAKVGIGRGENGSSGAYRLSILGRTLRYCRGSVEYFRDFACSVAKMALLCWQLG